MKTENVKITDVSITMGVHGCVTFYVFIEGSNWMGSLGGYCIGHGYLDALDSEFDGSAKGVEAMARIMDVVGVEKWQALKGCYARVESDGWGSKVTRIGNIIRDKWFDLDKFFRDNGIEEEQDG